MLLVETVSGRIFNIAYLDIWLDIWYSAGQLYKLVINNYLSICLVSRSGMSSVQCPHSQQEVPGFSPV